MHPPAQDVNLEKPSMKVPPKRKGNGDEDNST